MESVGSVFSDRFLVECWLKAVQDNTKGAPESRVNLVLLDGSRKLIISALWEDPDVKEVVKKVEELVGSSKIFDRSLSPTIKKALAGMSD